MKRLTGVIVSAVVLVLGSLLQLLMAAGMVISGAIQKSVPPSGGGLAGTAAPPAPSWMTAFSYGMGVFFILLGVWGILTSVGLFRMRKWARYSALVIGGCLVVIGVPAMLMVLVMAVVSLPAPPTMDPSQVHTFQTMARVGLGIAALVYAVVSAVGIWWLVYFNRKSVREAFAGGIGQIVESHRPFLISVVAVFMMIGGPACLLMALLPLPGAFLGLTLHGWQKVVLYLIYGAVLTAAGVALWQLKEWGRRLALAMQALGLVQFVIYIVRPSLMTSYSAEVNQTMGVAQNPLSPQFQNTMYAVTFGFSALLLIAIIVVLHHYRGAFRPPIEPAQSAPVIVS